MNLGKQVQKTVDEANKIMKMQVGPYIDAEITRRLEQMLKERIKPECFIEVKQ
jgi:hypothetical protein